MSAASGRNARGVTVGVFYNENETKMLSHLPFSQTFETAKGVTARSYGRMRFLLLNHDNRNEDGKFKKKNQLNHLWTLILSIAA